MSKTVLHLFHADPAAMQTVPALAKRIHDSGAGELEVFVFGPAEQKLASTDAADFNALIDKLVADGVAVTACIGLAQQMQADEALHARGLKLESAAVAFPRYAREGATVISF